MPARLSNTLSQELIAWVVRAIPLRMRRHSLQKRAVEQGVAPVEALELEMLHDVPSIIHVRLAGERRC